MWRTSIINHFTHTIMEEVTPLAGWVRAHRPNPRKPFLPLSLSICPVCHRSLFAQHHWVMNYTCAETAQRKMCMVLDL